jgi:hypothetical protein
MELTFIKRSGKSDDLTIVRDGAVAETIICPKQGIIPHDMVHYVVESVLTHHGFLSLVKDGRAADFTISGTDVHESVERLVETFQAEMWGGSVPAADLIATYEHACDARGHAAAPVSRDDVEAIRNRLEDLTLQWAVLPVNGALSVRF